MSFGGWVGSKANSFVYSLWSTFFLVIGAILLFIGGTASSSGEEWAFLPAWARHCALLLQFGHGSNQNITLLLFQQLEEEATGCVCSAADGATNAISTTCAVPATRTIPATYAIQQACGKKCGACGAMNAASNRFCGNCGALCKS